MQQKIADLITTFAGSMLFVYLHTVLFTVWIISRGFGLDSFPFNLLTMSVSLEAIYLSTFVLISQNREAVLAEKRNSQFQKEMLKEEKLDDLSESQILKNQEMLNELLKRIDLEHLSPIKADLNILKERLNAGS